MEINIQKVIDMYREGISCKKIGEEIGRSDTWIRQQLHANNVQMTQEPKNISQAEKEAIKNEFINGSSTVELHDKYNFSVNSIRRLLKKEGVYENRNASIEWNVDKQNICRNMVAEGRSNKDIAIVMECSDKVAANLLDKYNIRLKRKATKPMSEQEIKTMVALKEQGCNTVVIANILNRSDSTIGRKLISLGYENNGNALTDEDLKIIKDSYVYSGMTNKEIWEEFFQHKCSMKTVELATKKMGISRYGGTYNWDLERDYFKVIDTPDKAYLLGYITADAHVTGKVIHFECTYQDRELLEYAARQLCWSTTIHKRVRRTEPWRNPTATCDIGCVEMVDDLAKYNVVPLKQCQNFPLPELPRELYRDFIRGIFDGDGTCWLIKGRPQISICLDEVQAQQMEAILKDAGVITKLSNNIIDMNKYGENIYHLRITRKKDVQSFHDYIYYNNEVFRLKRKYDKIHTHLKSNTANTEIISAS